MAFRGKSDNFNLMLRNPGQHFLYSPVSCQLSWSHCKSVEFCSIQCAMTACLPRKWQFIWLNMKKRRQDVPLHLPSTVWDTQTRRSPVNGRVVIILAGLGIPPWTSSALSVTHDFPALCTSTHLLPHSFDASHLPKQPFCLSVISLGVYLITLPRLTVSRAAPCFFQNKVKNIMGWNLNCFGSLPSSIQLEVVVRSNEHVMYSLAPWKLKIDCEPNKVYYFINSAHPKSPRTETVSLLIETTDFLDFSPRPNR